MLFNSLKTAVPVIWRQKLKYEYCEEEEIKTKWETTLQLKHPSRNFYSKIIEKVAPAQESYTTVWNNDFKMLISEDISTTFINVFSVTNSVILRYFHYQIVNRILTTNVKRNYINKENSPLCDLCKKKKKQLYIYL